MESSDPLNLLRNEEGNASHPVENKKIAEDEEGEQQQEGNNTTTAAEDGVEEEEDEEDEDEEDNEEEEEDEEEEEEVVEGGAEVPSDEAKLSKGKRKRVSKGKGKAKKKSKQRFQGYRLFSDYAEEGSDEEEDSDEREAAEEVLGKEELAANEAVDRRHARQREFLTKSAEDIAREYEERERYEESIKRNYEGLDYRRPGAKAIPVAQQALLPKVTDPKIFKIRCKQGMEQVAIRSIMLKTLDMRQKDGFCKVKTAFCGDIKGFIYVEAISEAFAKEIVGGLKMIFFTSFAQVPIPDMPSVLSVTVKKKPLQAGQWVRIKRGPLKGDLARIIQVFEGGAKAFIQAIPRPDYAAAAAGESKKTFALTTTGKVRPPQRLFDSEQAKVASGGNVFRRYHPDFPSERAFDVWENDYYQDGFLYKMVVVASFIAEGNAEPKLEELQFFLNSINQAQQQEQNDFEDDVPGTQQTVSSKSLTQELTQQIQSIEDDNSHAVVTFMPGDFVLVIGGELLNLVARVISTNDIRKTAKIVAVNTSVPGEFEIEWSLLVKHVFEGAHVKVMRGRYMGQTGRVVSLLLVDGTQTAAILTDGLNSEIQCNVSFLQVTSEVATGLGSLMGYELYDLVLLNENESAIVINVMVERLRVLNHLENVKDVAPQEVRSKQNLYSNRAKIHDAQQNEISCGDTVNVVSGPHAKLTGTIKHIMRGTLWLHSDSFLKNSGIFVVKARNCVVAGGRQSSSYNGMTNMRGSNAAAYGKIGGNTSGGGNRIGRDALMGKSVRIKKGAYKGLLARVVDVTATHYSVELDAKMKKVVVPKEDVLPVDATRSTDNHGYGFNYGNDVIVPDTPYLTSATPAYVGSETPAYVGGETPMWSGSMTPYGQEESGWRGGNEDYSPPDNYDLHSRTTTPRLSEIADTPGTYFSTPGGSATPSVTSGAPDTIEFVPGMIVVMKKGELVGRVAVITSPSDELGFCMVKLRDGQNRLSQEELRVSVTDIGLSEASKNSNVIVLYGNKRNRTGVVKAAVGKDAMVAFDNGEEATIKRSYLACIFDKAALA